MADRKSQRASSKPRPAAAGTAPARAPRGTPALTTRWAVVILAILVLAFFHQVMLEGKTFVSPDANQPAGFVRVGEHSLWQEHTYPLWNPLVFLGMPSFGSGAYNPLIYPPDWPLGLVQKVLPLPDQTWLVLYYFLGALFLFLLAREWGAGPEGALIGAAAFVFAPNLVAVGAHGHGSQLVDSAYTPLLLWLASRWMRRGGIKHLAWLALAGGFQLLRGHVQICFYTWLAVALYAAIEGALQLRGRGSAEPGSGAPAPGVTLARLAGIGVAAALAFGVAGFYSLPLQDYARYSIRGGGAGGGVGLDYATAWSLAPYELLEIVVPGWVGFGGSTYWGGMPFTDYPNAYLGIVAIVLLVPTFLIRAARPAGPGASAPRTFAVALALLALLVAFGSHFPLYRFLYDHLPLFNKFRIPVMIVLLLQVAGALGAAWGWSAVLAAGAAKGGGAKGEAAKGPAAKDDDRARLSRALIVTAAVLAGALLIGALGHDAWQARYVRAALAIKGHTLQFGRDNYGPGQAGLAWQECSTSFIRAVILGLAAVAIAWIARGGRFRIGATGALLVLLLLELWPVSARVMAPVIGERASQPQEVGRDDTIEFLEKAGPPGSFRIFPIEEFQSNRFATFGIASVGGYHAAKPQLVQELLTRRFNENAYWMRLLNVRYIVAAEPYLQVPPMLKVVHEGTGQVLEFGAALPRVTVVGKYRVISPAEAIFDSIAIGSTDSGTITMLESDPGLTLGPVEGARATIDSYKLNDVSVTVETPGPALVRLADLWYPDWIATVDGRPAKILKADYLLRAVAVPAGRHAIEFHYRSKAVRDGLALSIASLLVVLAGIIGGSWARRPAVAAGPEPGPAGERTWKS